MFFKRGSDMKSIKPITKEEVQGVLDQNKKVLNLVKKYVGPTTWSDLRESLGISQAGLDNALRKGILLSPMSRNKKSSTMSGADALKWMSENMRPTESKVYASRIRRSANELDSD
tara:strand:+ start:1693 stop:2037 length:345 start_codon:yes stop_codon:yes gene_type:complete